VSTVQPIPPGSPVARQESGIVQGLSETSETGSYQTEFVRVYQDAGVIGVSMLTLLALCLLLGLFSLRLLKMYVALTESRDKIDQARNEIALKVAESLLTLEHRVMARLNELTIEINAEHGTHREGLASLNTGQERIHARLDARSSPPSSNPSE